MLKPRSLKFDEVIKSIEDFEKNAEGFPVLRIAFLRNITIDPIITYFKYFSYLEKLKPVVYMGEYDNVMQPVMDKTSDLYKHLPEVIVISLKMEVLSEKLATRFSEMSSEEVSIEAARVRDFIETVLIEIRKNLDAVILIQDFEVPVYPSFGIMDYQKDLYQVNTFREINRSLLDIIGGYKGVYLVSMESLMSRIGYLNFIDKRYWHMGRSPYTREASKIIALEYIKFIRALKGKNKKCLVVDCDNTLWGGIIGEEGMSNIILSKTYPGSSYREFQGAILNLYNRGILLAISSKNNEEDILEAIDKHPDMVLKKEHFVSIKANWEDKSKNIREIAGELNIGLDSIVFIDDSDFEVNLVRELLPEVTVMKLPEDPSAYKDILDSCGLFESLEVSPEDKKRTDMYRIEKTRKESKKGFGDTDLISYFKCLQMQAVIKRADEFSIPRISQLTQKTNQFNLTTKRYSISEIKKMSERADLDIFSMELEDRFGGYGIIGAAIVKYNEKEAVIDTFLLSCRAIGRRVEDILLRCCIDTAKKRGTQTIIGMYTKSDKNGQVEDFYQSHQFSVDKKSGGETIYSFDLKDKYPAIGDYFKSVEIRI